VIYALRVHGAPLELHETDDLIFRMRERLAHRGEPAAEVVVVQGVRLFGTPYSVNRVRAAYYNAAIQWSPINLDYAD
jgi:hypothetical protein